MNNHFNIYFDLKSNQEIIKYRKLTKAYILDSQDQELLMEYGIDEDKNPFHIIDFKSVTENTPVYEAVFFNTLHDVDYFETKVQPIGTYLIDFLNINLNDGNDLKKFAFKYGLDIFLKLDSLNLLNSYLIYTVSDFDKIFTKFFNYVKDDLYKLQQEFKESILFCFNDSGDKKLNKLNPKQKYFLSFHRCNDNIYFTKTPKFQKYAKGISIDYDSFFDTDINLTNFTTEELINKISSKDFEFAPCFYSCLRLENSLFISFINLLELEILHIKTCANCI